MPDARTSCSRIVWVQLLSCGLWFTWVDKLKNNCLRPDQKYILFIIFIMLKSKLIWKSLDVTGMIFSYFINLISNFVCPSEKSVKLLFLAWKNYQSLHVLCRSDHLYSIKCPIFFKRPNIMPHVKNSLMTSHKKKRKSFFICSCTVKRFYKL